MKYLMVMMTVRTSKFPLTEHEKNILVILLGPFRLLPSNNSRTQYNNNNNHNDDDDDD